MAGESLISKGTEGKAGELGTDKGAEGKAELGVLTTIVS